MIFALIDPCQCGHGEPASCPYMYRKKADSVIALCRLFNGMHASSTHGHTLVLHSWSLFARCLVLPGSVHSTAAVHTIWNIRFVHQ